MPTLRSDPPFRFRLEFPPELPISARAEEITAAIQANPVVILAGETGSGKTTQIPKMCLAAGRGTRGRIACTQPRRVAALSISRRVAEELGVAWGREVGCKIRFNDQTTPQTMIKFLTDGMLLAEVQGDPLLREYDTIIIDEAHERSLNIDFLLGHLRTLRYKRPDLKIIITSATIDTEAFSAAFDGAPVVLVEGRTFPVEVIYAPLDELGRDYSENDENEDRADPSAVASAKAEALHYIDGAVEAVERIVRAGGAQDGVGGDVLVFLPSERDIREVRELLEGRLRSAGQPVEVVPLFGRLSNAEQQRVFAPTQRRKIVLATNIAETSLTIPGIRYVVDTGLARLSRYSPQARTRRLPIEPVSQSSADQRKGRSGRVADGVCIRLYSESDYLERPRFTQPEIQRANLADVILRMKAFGLGDIERFPFINMPATKSIRAGYMLLEELGAIAPSGGREHGAGSKEQGARGAEQQGARGREQGAGSAEQQGARGREQGAGGGKSSGADPAPCSLLPAPASAFVSAELTPVGRELARLPVDPTVGRMILQARAEKALREVLVIAAGLSIQDPRERPLDKQQQADAAHRRFVHPDSDYLTLLNVWDAFHDEFESMSQAKLRRFCRDHFLSYTRMREWRDIYTQLLDVLKERDDFRMTSALHGLKTIDDKSTLFGTPPYRAIHRSILAGLLGNIAHLDEENGGYKATHDRRVNLFPGSVLFRREEPKRRAAPKEAGQRPAQNKDAKRPRWIISAEIIETTRLYARTCARLDPQWALELGAHLVRVAHSEPFWNEQNGRVMVKQRTRLYGLELESRAVSYGKIDPVHATEIFIREGLVNDTVTFPLDFIAHNRAVREKLEDLLTRARDSGYLNLDEAAYRFYAARLMPKPSAHGTGVGPALRSRPGVSDGSESNTTATQSSSESRPNLGISSVAELVDLVRERRGAEPEFLMMRPEDLRDPDTIAHDAEAFPEEMPIENRALPLNYAYKPGESDDGVTLEVNVREADALTPASLDWAVPGHLEAKVEHYLRTLPKELRRGFVPLAETAKSLASQLASRDRLTGRRESLTEAIAAQIAERFRIAIDPAVWTDKPLPDHLRVRVRVIDAGGKELAASRELAKIRAALASQSREASVALAREDPIAWRAVRAKWETAEHTSWIWGELPERILVTEQVGAPVYAFPGLRAGQGGVARQLFKTPEEARDATRQGLAVLLERQLGHELMWMQRDLRAMRELGALTATLAPLETLQEHAFESIRRWVTDPERIKLSSAVASRAGLSAEIGAQREVQSGAETQRHLDQQMFDAAVERAKADLRGIVPRFVDLLREILTLRNELLVLPGAAPGVARDAQALVPADFLRRTPYAQLAHLPRYLKAMKLRAERARQNPAKDTERAAQIAPYIKAAAVLQERAAAAWAKNSAVGNRAHVQARSEAVEAFRWLVEEFRVSLFAQELGTAEPVSIVKLDRALAALQSTNVPEHATRKAAAATAPTTPSSTPAAKPIMAAAVSQKKTAPIKNLNALDKLFGR